jgi:trypsin
LGKKPALFVDMIRRQSLFSTICGGLLLITASFSSAVILFSTGDPAQNTTEPTGLLTGSGWQYQGNFGGFLGTPIDPHHFITVQHIGVASTFVYQGANYTVVQWFDDTESDLRIFEVAETFPNYAPLYSRSDELGRSLVVFGRGTQRGDPVWVAGTPHGWLWGASDGVQRWGESQVNQLQGNYLYCTFDQAAGPNEADLSSGDSGGAAFTNDHGTWKLVGIHYGVDGPFANNPGDPTYFAALFDMRGIFDSTLGYVVSGSAPVPSGFYSIRISQRLAWIVSIVPAAAPAPTPTPTPAPTPSPSSGLAQMTNPQPGSTLTGARATFSWSAGNASAYKLFVGTSPGLSNIYNSGKLYARSATVATLPTNGSTIYVRLLSLVRSTWQSIDYTYTAASAASSTPTPAPTIGPSPTATPTATPRPSPPDRGGN